MKTATISTKEIRNDLEGFLMRLKNGQTLRVIYRSKPLVTLTARDETDEYLAEDAGSLAAARRSIRFVKNLPVHAPRLNPNKSFKELYDETRTL